LLNGETTTDTWVGQYSILSTLFLPRTELFRITVPVGLLVPNISAGFVTKLNPGVSKYSADTLPTAKCRNKHKQESNLLRMIHSVKQTNNPVSVNNVCGSNSGVRKTHNNQWVSVSCYHNLANKSVDNVQNG